MYRDVVRSLMYLTTLPDQTWNSKKQTGDAIERNDFNAPCGLQKGFELFEWHNNQTSSAETAKNVYLIAFVDDS